MSAGWIKVFRKIQDWEWYKDSVTKAVFLHLCLNANREDGMVRGIVVKRGQILTGRKKLSYELGESEGRIRRSLMYLSTTNTITIKSTNKHSIITILNYDDYQNKRESGKPTKQPTKDPVLVPMNDHKQEDKKIKKDIYITIKGFDEIKLTEAEAKRVRAKYKKAGISLRRGFEILEGFAVTNPARFATYASHNLVLQGWVYKAVLSEREQELRTETAQARRERANGNGASQRKTFAEMDQDRHKAEMEKFLKLTGGENG